MTEKNYILLEVCTQDGKKFGKKVTWKDSDLELFVDTLPFLFEGWQKMVTNIVQGKKAMGGE